MRSLPPAGALSGFGRPGATEMESAQAIAAAALRAAGAGSRFTLQPLRGGDASVAWRIETAARFYFLKTGPASHPFAAEAQALAEIAATGTLRAPAALAHGTAEGAGFLLLEWIDLREDGDWDAAGRLLSALHGCVGAGYGWPRENSIGASPQFNEPLADWAAFWRERRLRPQFALARARGLPLAALEDAACAASDARLAGHAPAPSLLHGDLWRGNLAFDVQGAPVVFDPATYHGDAETDLAMARLFGGFPPAFHRAYAAARPPAPAAAARLPLYQLYHVLNHANLFGGGYVAQARALVAAL